jgi:hypothetical protein
LKQLDYFKSQLALLAIKENGHHGTRSSGAQSGFYLNGDCTTGNGLTEMLMELAYRRYDNTEEIKNRITSSLSSTRYQNQMDGQAGRLVPLFARPILMTLSLYPPIGGNMYFTITTAMGCRYPNN